MDSLSAWTWPLALRSFHDGIAEIGCGRCDAALMSLDGYTSTGDAFSLAWLMALVAEHVRTCPGG